VPLVAAPRRAGVSDGGYTTLPIRRRRSRESAGSSSAGAWQPHFDANARRRPTELPPDRDFRGPTKELDDAKRRWPQSPEVGSTGVPEKREWLPLLESLDQQDGGERNRD